MGGDLGILGERVRGRGERLAIPAYDERQPADSCNREVRHLLAATICLLPSSITHRLLVSLGMDLSALQIAKNPVEIRDTGFRVIDGSL